MLLLRKIGLMKHVKPAWKWEHHIMQRTSWEEMSHMNLFSPIAYISIGGNKYGLVIIDDYSRFTWVFFLQDKSESQEVLKNSWREQKMNLMLGSRRLGVIMAPSSKTVR
jgi:hypothetical protein